MVGEWLKKNFSFGGALEGEAAASSATLPVCSGAGASAADETDAAPGPGATAAAQQGDAGEVVAAGGLNESLMRFCADIADARVELTEVFARQWRLRRMPICFEDTRCVRLDRATIGNPAVARAQLIKQLFA